MVLKFLFVKLEEVTNTWKLDSPQDQIMRICQKSNTQTRSEHSILDRSLELRFIKVLVNLI